MTYCSAIPFDPPPRLQGIFAATLSAALSTLIGASRILQAISKDGLLGDWFRIFSKEKGEPVRAVVLCWALVQCALALAWLDKTPLVTVGRRHLSLFLCRCLYDVRRTLSPYADRPVR